MAYQSKYSGAQIDEAIGKVSEKLDKTGDSSNTSVDFETAIERTELGKNDKLSVLIGKISAWLKGLKNVAFSGSYGDLENKPVIPTKTSDLTNDSNFASEAYVKNEIANAQLGGDSGEIDLSGYATKDDLNNKVDKVTGKSLIADTEIERLKNVTNYDDTEIKNSLNSKANSSDIPTKTSELNNDSGFLTEHQDISNLATKAEIPTKTSQLNNDNNFISSTVVTGFWSGTQDEYDSLGTHNSTTLYLITES